VKGDFAPGYRPLALQSLAKDVAVVYFPAGGEAALTFPASTAEWFDPRNGSRQATSATGSQYSAPPGTDGDGHPMDYVLVLRR
jgi:Putative collagen-binding domain of a collagenase